MQILSRDSLPLGGFAGIREHRLVTDSRLFAGRKSPETFEGLGSMVYLADAKYNPNGESGMHPHSEIDVISIVVEGRVSHQGSMEHGKDLIEGNVQVQRAGGEGFEHNEINPDNSNNRMLQVWALPEEQGRPASYKFYEPKNHGSTRIYGGNKEQSETFDSNTIIEIIYLRLGEMIELVGEQLSYVISGNASYTESFDGKASDSHIAKEGDLIRTIDANVKANSGLHLLVVSNNS